jgi:hypothetical protein
VNMHVGCLNEFIFKYLTFQIFTDSALISSSELLDTYNTFTGITIIFI